MLDEIYCMDCGKIVPEAAGPGSRKCKCSKQSKALGRKMAKKTIHRFRVISRYGEENLQREINNWLEHAFLDKQVRIRRTQLSSVFIPDAHDPDEDFLDNAVLHTALINYEYDEEV